MKAKYLLCTVVSFNILNFSMLSKLVIQTTGGPVRGKINYYDNFVYYSYQGIPYAESPTGKLRFQPPVPKKPWKHVLDATHIGVVCPQLPKRYKYEHMNEDCLIINIYVPKCSKQEQLPVLVFIHGGGFMVLSGRPDLLYGPQFFLQREMIFVTLNYRLGPLGFLSLGISEASGNAGIKDVLLALNWIKKNIHNFGGNNNKITIGGHSSGAALVHYLLLIKHSDGLFQQAILISGSALNHRSLSIHSTDEALSLANELGITSKNNNTILKELQEADVYDILKAFSNLCQMDSNILKPCSLFSPCIEKDFSHAIITENPWFTLEKSGLAQNIPILTGINAQEGLYMLPSILKIQGALEQFYTNFELGIPSNIEYPERSLESRRLRNLISEMYLYKFDDSPLDKIIKLTSDILYVYSVYAWIKLHKRNPKSNRMYLYNFNFDGDLNYAKLTYKIEHSGTSHADELGYIFVTNTTYRRIKYANNKSKKMVNVIVKLFSDFITFGSIQQNNVIRPMIIGARFTTPCVLMRGLTPTRSGLWLLNISDVNDERLMDGYTTIVLMTPQNINVPWPEFDLKEQKYLDISENLTVLSLLNSSETKIIHFWDSVYNMYKKYVNEGGRLQNRWQISKNYD